MSSSAQPGLSPIWDQILGTRSQVRVLRVVASVREPLSVRELARRAGEHLRSVQRAVERLLELSILQTVGSGHQQLIALNVQHPLLGALDKLFAAEVERTDRILTRLRQLAREFAGSAHFIWLQESDASLQIGLLTNSIDINAQTDALRGQLAALTRDEFLLTQLQVWTKPDLESTATAPIDPSLPVVALWGVMPAEWSVLSNPGKRNQDTSARKESLAERAERLAKIVRKRPELLREARAEVQRQLETADPLQLKTLREWEQLLASYSPGSFVRWLRHPSEASNRLLQSLPKTLRLALSSDREHKP